MVLAFCLGTAFPTFYLTNPVLLISPDHGHMNGSNVGLLQLLALVVIMLLLAGAHDRLRAL